jgi:hypothetical protein
MNNLTKRTLYAAAALMTCLLLAWGIWRGFARFSDVDLGDGLFYEAHLSGPDTNCILVQLPPRKDYKRPTFWSRLGLFQARLGTSPGPRPFTTAIKDVQFGGGFHHVLVAESLLREYGHDPAEFLPANYKESGDYLGAKPIYFRRRSGHRRQWYECARESLTNVGIAVVELGAEVVILVPQANAGRFARIEAGDLRRREGMAIDVRGEPRGVLVQLERSVAGSGWMPYSPPFTNRFQFDQRMVVNDGPDTKWRVKQVEASQQ